jgi:hypothetical protein
MFDKPKEDPAAKERARLAEEERIKGLQEDLRDVTALKVRRFGSPFRLTLGAQPTVS